MKGEPDDRARFLEDVLLPICEQCEKRPARVSVTRTTQDGQKQIESLCVTCARATGGFIFGSMLGLGLADDFPVDDDGNLDEHIVGAPFEAIMDFCFARDDEIEDEQMDEWEDAEWLSEEDPFEDEPSLASERAEDLREDESNLLRSMEAQGDEGGAICSGCGATWPQIAVDERAGCARCYSTFRASLTHLLEQVQREAKHFGKMPRAAQKRRLRLEHLRRRRDNQLVMLQNRLAEAVKFERYEEAATLRDKIKVVSSSLF